MIKIKITIFQRSEFYSAKQSLSESLRIFIKQIIAN